MFYEQIKLLFYEETLLEDFDMEIGKETNFYKGLVGYGVKITKDINLMLDCNLILIK